MSTFERISGWVGIAAYALLIYEMYALWTAPEYGDASRILTLTVIMAFEFFMSHSGVAMAVAPKKFSLFLLVPIYGAFALMINSLVPGNTILWLYLGVVLIRMRFAFSDHGSLLSFRISDQVIKNFKMSIIAVSLYFLLTLVFGVFADLVPRRGLTEEYLVASGYREMAKDIGIFSEYPQMGLLMGIIYFSLLAISEVVVFGLLKRSEPEADPV